MTDIASTIEQGRKLVADGGAQEALLAFLSRSGLSFLEAIRAVGEIYAVDLRASTDMCATSGYWRTGEDNTPAWRFRGLSNGEITERSGDEFDELVVFPWFHIERLDKDYHWLRIGAFTMEVEIEDGHVKRLRRVRRDAASGRR